MIKGGNTNTHYIPSETKRDSSIPRLPLVSDVNCHANHKINGKAHKRYRYISHLCIFALSHGSIGGVVAKLLVCGERGPGFDSRSRRYDFRDLLSCFKSRFI